MAAPATPSGGVSVPYSPGLDGLRAVAVASVLLGHAGTPVVGNGAGSGVEVFFVLSGYLITRLLRNQQRQAPLAMGTFYLRRLQRLMPALVATVVLCSLYAITFPNRPESQGTLAAVPYVLLYVGNLRAALSGVSLGLLGHTWSLAIEEQFYLVWPWALVAAGAAFARRNAAWALLGLSVLVAGLSTVWRIYLSSGTTPGHRTYQGTDTRAAAILVGCGLALILELLSDHGRRHLQALLKIAIGPALVVVLAAFVVRLGGDQAALWGFPLLEVASAVIVATVVTMPSMWAARALAWHPLTVVGKRSYGAYLYGVPITAIVASWSQQPIGINIALEAALTTAIVAFSYRYIEQPFRVRRSVPDGGGRSERGGRHDPEDGSMTDLADPVPR